MMDKKIENKISKNKLLRNIKLDYIGTFLVNLNMQSSIWVLYLLYCGLNLAQVGFLEGIYKADGVLLCDFCFLYPFVFLQPAVFLGYGLQ